MCNLLGDTYNYRTAIVKSKEYFYVGAGEGNAQRDEEGRCEPVALGSEYFDPEGIGNKMDHGEKIHTCESMPIRFNWEDGEGWKGERSSAPAPVHKYRPLSDKAGLTLGETVEYLVDKDRLVKATTNNPQSSRSHTLIHIKLEDREGSSNPQTAHLFVGDFAGVENAFVCEDANTLMKMLSAKKGKDPAGE